MTREADARPASVLATLRTATSACDARLAGGFSEEGIRFLWMRLMKRVGRHANLGLLRGVL